MSPLAEVATVVAFSNHFDFDGDMIAAEIEKLRRIFFGMVASKMLKTIGKKGVPLAEKPR
ncbi:hypothetical protein GVN21_13060 [Caulobacter sp. SLTY]|uniref:hypothetical protein n=1 Tax=Caulobacter sp. SLTY TaxID=2683262 RepID=UPI001412E60C|nr:hypothetical protein [Caulobacter sp. SLTY]NBB16289.1 hypothetical protein [Caulobacter sp. SLTY]